MEDKIFSEKNCIRKYILLYASNKAALLTIGITVLRKM